MEKGLVSVLLLSMNHERFVVQACNSILSQTYKNIEIIYVDNNSGDKTFEIADELLKNAAFPYKGFKRTGYYGISANLNFLLKEANGEFIAVLSGDDWWDKENLQTKVSLFDAEGKIGLVHGNGQRFVEVENKYYPFFNEDQKTGDLFKDLLTGNLFYSTGIVFRHSAIKSVGYFDENLAIEDWDMNLRVAEKFQVAYTNKNLSFLRVTGKNISLNIDFMDKGYEEYFKKYTKYPEMKLAKKNIVLSNAFILAKYHPGFKTMGYLLKNFQFDRRYWIQVLRCLAGMVGIRPGKK